MRKINAVFLFFKLLDKSKGFFKIVITTGKAISCRLQKNNTSHESKMTKVYQQSQK